MKDIIIVGAGGFGRELLQWIKDINEHKPQWRIKGFIDDNQEALNGYACSHSVLGTIEDWTPTGNEVFACAVAEPQTKENVVHALKSRGAMFASVIHPTALIGEHNSIGEGVTVYPYARITANVTIGDYVTLLAAIVGHDVTVGDFSTISSHCGINGEAILGKRVFLGSHAVIIPGKRVGDDAYVGAGSVVVKNVKAHQKTFGNPARPI